MRQRITYIHEAEGAFNPNQVPVGDDSLSIQSLQGSKEARVTFGFKELPQELWQVLKQCHELHVRWVTERPYDAVSPFSSRVSPGLHVFYTPASQDQPTSQLCPLLREVFSTQLKCTEPEESFISPPILSTRFASTSALQFYQSLSSLEELVTYIQQKICPQGQEDKDNACYERAASLLSADSLDIDYDNISHALTISAYWSQPSSSDGAGWNEKINKDEKGAHKVEVGLLAIQEAIEPEEISVGGFLAVVGEDSKLKPTLFSFPSRHHPLPSTSIYTVNFQQPTGLHPTLQLSIPRSSLTPPPAPADSTCALHTYLTLPSAIFADKYQLSTTDTLFLQSHNLIALRSIAGETDLEAPDWVTKRWGSNLLLELATPPAKPSTSDNDDGDWEITIPLHLRYLHPSASGYRNTSIPWPIVFWACTSEEGTKMGTNPFDRVNLGWDGLFGPRTMFYQLHPSLSEESTLAKDTTAQLKLVEQIKVPVLGIEDGDGDRSQARNIEVITVIVILAGFFWVLWKLGRVVKTSGFGRNRSPLVAVSKDEVKDKKE
ncbi:hypothetical protein AJ80_07586 [Polytolypa hystricis UAMH7299]|uniref:Protein PBN1 n=1 Tax=Polytolypa hystricis (strain UAMH7299) TaxID=1447883 RepID=A0A2B7XMH5_POLH7|nr:hypothetical protein AJ80_07586 [Polytolypa hystricis UAMH7299]